ncbi:AI-2E family transporter [Commensalibacter oyaizuii]|uniref:AI-2E family transporter n=1 Tax=Commensalibacter oyaizuii TaxID=3043873 RepID=A0ABT6PZI1_9PROT|nr:AI-2E family transporter [Commensalibacter sp. TBRC 16381]MDI2090263.1 AI-2E family transporter [Commensalibacter sp. TBRC 16381]
MDRRIILYILLAAITYGCWLILRPLFSSILWAGIISFATWPMYVFLRKYVGKVFASLLMTIFCSLCVVMPIIILTSAIIDDAPKVLKMISSATASINFVSPPNWVQHVPVINKYLIKTWEQGAEHLLSIGDSLRPYLYDITRASLSMFLQTVGGFLQFVFALFISFFFWLSGDYLGEVLLAVVYKVAGPSSKKLVEMTNKTILGTVYGIIGTALLQGILTGCGLALFSIPEPVLLGGIAAFLSLFPIGAPVVWIPAVIWLIVNHHILSGILLLLYGIVFISGVEHIIRPMFVSSGNKLPYLLSVLGILGGVLAFGGLGIFLGPVLLGLGYSLTMEFSTANEVSK